MVIKAREIFVISRMGSTTTPSSHIEMTATGLPLAPSPTATTAPYPGFFRFYRCDFIAHIRNEFRTTSQAESKTHPQPDPESCTTRD